MLKEILARIKSSKIIWLVGGIGLLGLILANVALIIVLTSRQSKPPAACEPCRYEGGVRDNDQPLKPFME